MDPAASTRRPERRLSRSPLDADLVDELERSADEGLSTQVNDAVRVEVERRRRRRALRTMLDRLDLEDGPLGPDDEAEIVRFEQALGGR